MKLEMLLSLVLLIFIRATSVVAFLGVSPVQLYRQTSCSISACASKGANSEGSEDDSSISDGISADAENETDWITAEFTLRQFPAEPDPALDPHSLAVWICRSVQFVDYPSSAAGLERIFDFFTWECRKAVTARQGGDTVERFCQYGLLSPALQPMMGATRIVVGDDGTLTPGTPTRGALYSFPITVYGASNLKFQYSSGHLREGIHTESPRTDLVLRLEQARRPPLTGCWLVREILDVRHAFAGDMGNALS
uniref:Uncharacterized protein n=1 Tax=Attheya septentrionalis TaxID=420275 RepID=A0A7S2XKT3_9STRA|mmetsp:Transcript_17829/g.32278  ORF Transcript_17829/g.32278 Transcript_17829/m.32278 type:complete len:252 (+) Transcript_17829:113-868(+)|eukprot:CAMPEP_0198298624 /NCGR_PEP_ID=MMETSP1449-20131203/41499_1 /TAXON_ID=420275 /ORGANISM="Attheya septentrionalis, Strain CCMP2084" /LENGTH=251 /DNA_ID=CAMNT_0043999931 /DNA_START=33 /DNA_END=788 /DNA_ORIENTATION=+